MAQKLILPINKTRITAGYKNAYYANHFNFKHYGADSVSTDGNRTLWGSGVGKVLLAGFDSILGNVLVIRYDDCQLTTGVTRNLIQRIYHMDRIDVQQGQSITKDTRIGLYGSTGQFVSGAHLHVEFDTDTAYPAYSPTLSSSSNIIKAGTDSTLNPTQCMYVKSTAPDYQSVVGTNSNFLTSSDLVYAKHDGGSTGGGGGAAYFPIPNYSGTSIVGALDALGEDSSFSNREKIATANGISNYEGTAPQNNQMLSLLMSGKLIKPTETGGGGGAAYFPIPNYSGTSITGALDAIGEDSSFSNREKIATANGISNYEGTAPQNNQMLSLLMSGKLKRPGTTGGGGGHGSEDDGNGDVYCDSMFGLVVKRNMVATGNYDIKCPYPMNPTHITVHNTYNDASAADEISYMIRNSNEVSFHIAVDDKEVVQGLPLNRNGWHAGDGANGEGNRKSIAVEICYSKSGGEKFIKAERNAARVIASLMRQFNIPLDRMRSHQYWSGKYCPHRTLDTGYDRFKDMVAAQLPAFEANNNRLFNEINQLSVVAKEYDSLGNKRLKYPLQYYRKDSYSGLVWDGIAGAISQGYLREVESKLPFTKLQKLIDPMSRATVPMAHLAVTFETNLQVGTARSYVSDYAGWAGDLVSLIKNVHDRVGRGQPYQTIYNETCTLLGDEGYNFGMIDVYSDFDAVNMFTLQKQVSYDNLGDLFKDYYASQVQTRYQRFIVNRFGTTNKEEIYDQVYAIVCDPLFSAFIADWVILTTAERQGLSRAFVDKLYEWYVLEKA